MFLYVFMSSASISFPHLFLCSLNEVYRSSAVGHALIHSIFIHRIFLFLGLADFPSGEPVHEEVHLLVLFPLFPLLQVLMLLRRLVLLLPNVPPLTTLDDSDI